MTKNLHLQEGEKVLLTLAPAKNASWYFFLSRVWHIFVILIFAVFYLLARDSQNLANQYNAAVFPYLKEIALGIAAFLVLFLVFGWLYTKTMLSAYQYVITNQRCLLNYGFFSLNQRMIPFSKISDLDLRATFVERLFGLGSVYIENVATIIRANNNTANNTTRLEGLSLEECNQAMDVISHQINQHR